MNMHPFLQQLLAGQAVEWKPLGEVAYLTRGRVISKQYLDENRGDYPVYSSQTVNNGEIGKIDTFDFDGEYVSWTTDGANAGTVFYRTGKFSITNVCGLIQIQDLSKLDYKFLFYWLSISAKHHVYSGMGNPKLMSNQMSKIKIPIPPLSVQTKIAQILDAFTAITAELTAELSMRNKQYQYYRDKLLSENELAKVGFEWKSLGEVLIRTKGTKITAGQMKELHKENAPLKIFAGGKTFALVDFDDIPQKDINTNPSVIVKSRGIIEFEYYDKPFSHKNEMWSYYSDNENILIKFVYYFLKSKESYFQQLGSKMQMPQIATPDTDKFLIPIPPLSAQTKIVQILDKFDTLTRSISDGLPREIELRQQQYEYYREMLLGFERE